MLSRSMMSCNAIGNSLPAVTNFVKKMGAMQGNKSLLFDELMSDFVEGEVKSISFEYLKSWI